MKRKKTFTVKKLLFYFFIVVAVGLYVLLKLQTNKMPDSFKNAGYGGNALYYDTLIALDYDVSYDLNPIDGVRTDGLVVLNVASNTNELEQADYNKIFDFVKAGGKMLVLFPGSVEENSQAPEQEGFISVKGELSGKLYDEWLFGSDGVLLYGSIHTMSNTLLSTDRETAYRSLQVLHPYIVNEGIVFNEYYLYINKGQKRSLWKEMPQGIRFTLISLLLVGFIYVWHKGRRFGAPLKLYEEVEPDENQYAKAVGFLYYQSDHWEVLVDSYYHHLLSKIYRKFLLYKDVGEENWISVFENHKEKEFKAAKKVFHFMKDYRAGNFKQLSKRKMRKTIKEILITMQNLEKSID